jgi:hypothetical protein
MKQFRFIGMFVMMFALCTVSYSAADGSHSEKSEITSSSMVDVEYTVVALECPASYDDILNTEAYSFSNSTVPGTYIVSYTRKVEVIDTGTPAIHSDANGLRSLKIRIEQIGRYPNYQNHTHWQGYTRLHYSNLLLTDTPIDYRIS